MHFFQAWRVEQHHRHRRCMYKNLGNWECITVVSVRNFLRVFSLWQRVFSGRAISLTYLSRDVILRSRILHMQCDVTDIKCVFWQGDGLSADLFVWLPKEFDGGMVWKIIKMNDGANWMIALGLGTVSSTMMFITFLRRFFFRICIFPSSHWICP